MENNKIDFICQHSMDGSIIPMRIRLRDEDGELQEYTIKGYRDKSEHNMKIFECKIIVFNTAKLVTIFCSSDGIWYVKR